MTGCAGLLAARARRPEQQRQSDQDALHVPAVHEQLGLEGPDAGRESTLDEWRGKFRVAGHDSEIGAERKVESGAIRISLDANDDGLG